MFKKFSLLLFITISNLFSQQFIFDYSIGSFKNASAFNISSSGFIYVTDSQSNEVFKLDTLGNIIKDVGGYGWKESLFDNPVDVFATALNIYVCDKNNHRLQRFDKDLNFISQLSTRESDNPDEHFGYPLSCAASNQGDLYILDSENKRVIKFDLFGNFIQNFGGYESGQYSLSDPNKLAVSSSNNIFVIDKNGIIIFDQYGNGLLNLKSPKDIKNINITFDYLTLTSDSSIYLTNLKSSDTFFNEAKFLEEYKEIKIVGSFFYNQKLYLLTPVEILVYKFLK
ncbi:MAG: NHL repeat-containing protein [Ignavibacteriaceae bacterium]